MVNTRGDQIEQQLAELPDRSSRGLPGRAAGGLYAGYRALADRGDVLLAFCWSHVRQRLYELAAAGPAPIASEALIRIASLYAVETEIRSQSAEARVAARQEQSRPVINAMEPWLRDRLETISQKGKLAEAIRHSLSR